MEFKNTEYGDLTGKTYVTNIDCSFEKLTSLKGAPKEVKGYFNCSNNRLKTLKGAPKVVKKFFFCHNNNRLMSLEETPEIVKGDYKCSRNNIKTLDYLPKEVGGFFDCSENPLTQNEIDKLVQCKIKGRIFTPNDTIEPSKDDYKLYNKVKDYQKYLKIKRLKDKL